MRDGGQVDSTTNDDVAAMITGPHGGAMPVTPWTGGPVGDPPETEVTELIPGVSVVWK